MLHSNYNLLTLQGLEPSNTYLDKLPKDLVWYLLGYTGAKDGYVVLRKRPYNYYNSKPLEIVKATTVHTLEELKEYYEIPYNYPSRFCFEPVKFIFIDGKQYAAVPIKKKIDGFTPKRKRGKKAHRCKGYTKENTRCKHRTTDKSELCSIHRKQD